MDFSKSPLICKHHKKQFTTIHISTRHTYYSEEHHLRITYSSPVDEAKHKSGHLGCEDYHDDDKKLMQIQRKVQY